jgi:hypothetical protein
VPSPPTYPTLMWFSRPMDDAHQDHGLGTMAPTVWRDVLVLHYEIPKLDGDLGRSNCTCLSLQS